jgi:hypothetical protein
MQNILRLLGVIFADPQRSIEDLSAGFLEHNTLFQAVPDPTNFLKKNKERSQTYAEQLTGFNTSIGSNQAGQQVGRTLTLAEKKKALKRIQMNHASLSGDIVVPDATLRATLLELLYPNGLEDFSKASFKTLPDKLRVYLDQVQNPDNQVPQLLIDRSVDELTPFATTREKQVLQQLTTTTARSKRRLLLPHLEEQLTRNFHGLCVVFEEDRTEVTAYYNSRYLGDDAVPHPGRHSGRVDKMHTNQVVNLDAQPARYILLTLQVEEDFDLLFYRATDSKVPAPADALRVSAATPLTVALTAIPGTGPLLLVCNENAYVGHYEAQLLAE